MSYQSSRASVSAFGSGHSRGFCSKAPPEEEDPEIDVETFGTPVGSRSSALTSFTVPDLWPQVPVIAVRRQPVFPKFIKIIEVTEPRLMSLIRRKVKLNQPYAGVFMKKDESNESEVVNSVDELHSVGSFCQIHELQDLGDKLRMIVMAHRRVRIQKQVIEEPSVDDSKITKRRNRRRNNIGAATPLTEAGAATPLTEAGVTSEPNEPNPEIQDPALEQSPPPSPIEAPPTQSASPGVLIVETENFNHDKFENSEELKALTQEIVKTIRDIISNPHNNTSYVNDILKTYHCSTTLIWRN